MIKQVAVCTFKLYKHGITDT